MATVWDDHGHIIEIDGGKYPTYFVGRRLNIVGANVSTNKSPSLNVLGNLATP